MDVASRYQSIMIQYVYGRVQSPANYSRLASITSFFFALIATSNDVSNKNMKNILVVGQTPPPFGGQAVMIQKLLDAKYTSANLYHVRMSFSKSMDDLGTLRIGKFFHAITVVCKIVVAKIRYGTNVLYFPPSGPDLIPVLRDIFVLVLTRWMFKQVVFHFHASGLCEIYETLPWYLKPLYRIAYFYPDVAIQLSKFNPDDGGFLKAKRKYFISNGIDDGFKEIGFPVKPINSVCTVLFVGLIIESKGVLVLIEAFRLLKERGVNAKLNLVGQFSSNEFESVVRNLVKNYGLEDSVEFKGVLTGKTKYQEYLKSDIFCFPTFFESESFGLVVVEAMSFSLPIVVSRWRGVQSLIWEGENGFGVPPHEVNEVADRLIQLIMNPDLRISMGARGRQIFLDNFTLEKFRFEMDQCFLNI